MSVMCGGKGCCCKAWWDEERSVTVAELRTGSAVVDRSLNCSALINAVGGHLKLNDLHVSGSFLRC